MSFAESSSVTVNHSTFIHKSTITKTMSSDVGEPDGMCEPTIILGASLIRIQDFKSFLMLVHPKLLSIRRLVILHLTVIQIPGQAF